MKILTWNILANEFILARYYQMIPKDILYDRKNRQIQIINTLKNIDADVMILQEVMQAEYNLLDENFKSAYFLIRGKHIIWQNKRSYSGNVILIRKSMFAINKNSDITDLAFGVVIKCYLKGRDATVRDATVQHAMQTITIINVHLDDINVNKRLKQIKEIEPILHDNYNIILAGDFNENYIKSSKVYNMIKSSNLNIYNNDPTYFIDKKECIDNIMLKGFSSFKNIKQIAINTCKNNILEQFINYGSDHLPVVVDII